MTSWPTNPPLSQFCHHQLRSIHRDEDIERLHNIRERTTYLVALGACACNGNVQARANFVAPAVNYAVVYGEEARNRVQVTRTSGTSGPTPGCGRSTPL